MSEVPLCTVRSFFRVWGLLGIQDTHRAYGGRETMQKGASGTHEIALRVLGALD